MAGVITVDENGHLLVDGQPVENPYGSIGSLNYDEERARSLYDQYLRGHIQSNQNESGSNVGEVPFGTMTQDDYANLPFATQMQLAGQAQVDLNADDPLAQQFRQRFGDTPSSFSPAELNNQQLTGYRIGVDNGRGGPNYGEANWADLAQDPNRILWLDPEGTPNRRYVYEAANANGDVFVREQSRNDDSGLGDGDAMWRTALMLFGGIGAAQALGFMAPGVSAAAGTPGTVGMLGVDATGALTAGTSAAAAGTTAATGAAGLSDGAFGTENFLGYGGAGGSGLEGAVAPATSSIGNIAGGGIGAAAPSGGSISLGAGGLAPEEMGLANYAAGAGLPAGLNWTNIGRTIGSLLQGGGQNAGGGLIALGGGSAPRIGDHKTDNDPYGLMASGFGPWSGIIEDPQKKVTQALMQQNPFAPWG